MESGDVESRKKVVAVSGYFDPVHEGHLEYFKLARELGDRLVVILNNDKQAAMKKGGSFMSENGRKLLLESLSGVDEVFLSIDEDRSVCESIRAVSPDIFANGGDRFSYEVPEAKVCRELGIKIVDGLGEKIQSSSSLVKKSKLNFVERFWGSFVSIENGDGYQVKRLTVKPGKRISLQRHLHRSEHWVVVNGVAKVTLGGKEIVLRKNESTYVPVGTIHRLENPGKIPLEIIEVQNGEYLGEDDIERLEDDFGRVEGEKSEIRNQKSVEFGECSEFYDKLHSLRPHISHGNVEIESCGDEVDVEKEEFCIGEGCYLENGD